MHGALGILARIVKVLVGIIVALIVLGILFTLLEANPRNGIVSAVKDVAGWLVGPFEDLFQRPKPKEEIAINWGIAAAVYLLIGALIVGLLGRLGGAVYARGEGSDTDRKRVGGRRDD